MNWRSDYGTGDHGGRLTEAKVTYFCPVVAVQQNIFQFDVSACEKKENASIRPLESVESSPKVCASFETANYLCISP